MTYRYSAARKYTRYYSIRYMLRAARDVNPSQTFRPKFKLPGNKYTQTLTALPFPQKSKDIYLPVINARAPPPTAHSHYAKYARDRFLLVKRVISPGTAECAAQFIGNYGFYDNYYACAEVPRGTCWSGEGLLPQVYYKNLKYISKNLLFFFTFLKIINYND